MLTNLRRNSLKRTLFIVKLFQKSLKSVSTYEGEGKTVARMLNKDIEFLMVNTISNAGFRLNNGVQLIGPSILFTRSVLSWNVRSVSDVNAATLSIFSILLPKMSIVILGYGDENSLTESVKKDIIQFGRDCEINFELLPTEAAVSTFNFLNYERRLVAGAFIPPVRIKLYDDSHIVTERERNELLKMDLLDEK